MSYFKITKQPENSFARKGEIETPHGKIKTPVFMPCGTVGAVKGISAEELKEIGFEIILGNTYHLYLRPGEKLIKKHGGIQKFTNWNKPILTDSGGYQLFSLGNNYKMYEKNILRTRAPLGIKSRVRSLEYSSRLTSRTIKSLAKATSKGVQFRSIIDGSSHLFTPEKVIDIQLDLGSDIIMPLDYCPNADASKREVEKAVDLTNKWFERAFRHFKKKTKNLKNKPAIFAIVQGSFYKDLREKSYKYLSQFPVDGFAIGGVANGGESKLKQQKAIEYTVKLLPDNLPRYLMGVGEPEDIIYAVSCGLDMFDCVLPTRLGRHGTVWVTKNWPLDLIPKGARGKQKFSKIDLRKSQYRQDKNIIMKSCGCPSCRSGYSRAYISHLIREKEMLGMRLASLHNLWILHELITKIRKGI